MLASWSRDEMMISEPAGRVRMRERLEKSWVVEGPITATQTLSVTGNSRPTGYQRYQSHRSQRP